MELVNKQVEPSFLKLWKAYEDTKTPILFMDWAETKLDENKKLSPIKSKRTLLHTQSMFESSNFNKGEQISIERKSIALK